MQVLIAGCGYVGCRLAVRLRDEGHTVAVTNRTPTSGIAGVENRILTSTTAGPELSSVLDGTEVLVYLAPPDRAESAAAFAQRFETAAPAEMRFIYGSTTGVYGTQSGWVDERTEAIPSTDRGQARLEIENALRASALDIQIVRIAGIYGPGRTVIDRMARGDFIVIENAPPTSRIHVDDLVRIFEAMLGTDTPPLVVAADGHPATTNEVAAYGASLAGLPEPPIVSRQAAREILSPLGFELRTNGRQCRSLECQGLIGSFRYPTYQEGLRESLGKPNAIE